MPISSKVLIPRSAEAGKIKIGQIAGKAGKDGKRPGKFESKDGPYFLITKTIRGTDPEKNFMRDATLMKQLEPFMEKDQDGVLRLRQIPVMLDSDAIEEIAPSRLALYRGTNLFCAGTGAGKDAATRWEGGVPAKHDCPCEFLTARSGEKCKPNLILWCTIIAGADTRLGVRHAFRTTGWNSIKAILAGLETIQAQVGTICGIKLWLCVKWDLKKDATGTTRKVPVVYVECRTSDLMGLRQQAIASARKRLEVMQLSNPAVLSLPAPAVAESKDTQAAVTAEWYPSQQAASDAPDDGEDDEDEAFYDPETGEVYEEDDDDGNAEDAGQSRTVTPQMIPKEEVKPDAASEAPAWHRRLGPMLKKLVELRNLPTNQESMIEVLVQLTTDAFGKPIPFMQLTLEQAAKIDTIVGDEIKKRQAEVWIPQE